MKTAKRLATIICDVAWNLLWIAIVAKVFGLI